MKMKLLVAILLLSSSLYGQSVQPLKFDWVGFWGNDVWRTIPILPADTSQTITVSAWNKYKTQLLPAPVVMRTGLSLKVTFTNTNKLPAEGIVEVKIGNSVRFKGELKLGRDPVGLSQADAGPLAVILSNFGLLNTQAQELVAMAALYADQANSFTDSISVALFHADSSANAANTAKIGTETAKTGAEQARNQSQIYRDAAQNFANTASAYSTSANTAKSDAELARDAAAASATSAYNSMTTTQQAVLNKKSTNVNVSTTYTIDLAGNDNTIAEITLTGNTTLTILNYSFGKTLNLKVNQGGAGGFRITNIETLVYFPGAAAIDWATASGGVNIFFLTAFASTGQLDGTYYKR